MSKPSEVSERLYHYTNWEGLLGILRDKTLWATHYKFLNDYSEIGFLRNKLISRLIPIVHKEYERFIKQSSHDKQKIIQKGRRNQVVQQYTENVVDKLYGATGHEFYILSFCGQHKKTHVISNGLLSQWRGYGSDGGFALAFNTQKLDALLKMEVNLFNYNFGHFCDVIYSDDDNKFEKELSPDLSIIAKAAILRLFFSPEKSRWQTIPKEASDAYGPFVKCISRYKHCGFSEENEFRVVTLLDALDNGETVASKAEKERKFRLRNGQLVPYIELFKSLGIDLPIEKIIVGPHKEKETRTAALSIMLRNTKIEITCSDIPYVG